MKNRIESHFQITDTHIYNFTIYVEGGEKHHTDFYTLENARLMRDKLESKKEVYTITLWDENDQGQEINSI